jgi:hypothetical protein
VASQCSRGADEHATGISLCARASWLTVIANPATGTTPRLAARVDQVAGDFTVRFLARTFLRARLGGLSPAALTDEERAELHELFSGQGEQLDQALEILERVGYGRPRGRRPRKERAYGQRRDARLDGLVGKLPRALAKRLPTSADTHRSGSNDGEDVYGPVSCSRTLRSGHLGILAAAGGLWHSRNRAACPYAETTAGELVQLITGRQRLGGKDIAEIHRLSTELEQLELSATVNRPKYGGKPNLALAIPRSPVERVERRLPDGRWVDAHAYQDALANLSNDDALTTYAWASPCGLSVHTVIPQLDLAIELHSKFTGHPATPTAVAHLALGPPAHAPVLTHDEQPSEHLCPGDGCMDEHAMQLVELLRRLGHEPSMDLPKIERLSA